MPEFPYVAVPTKLVSLFQRIKSVGVPERVSTNWLYSVGFTSSNDRSMLPVLEYVGFVDASREPTDSWMEYRNEARSKKVLAIGIRQGYYILYEVYPDAQTCSEEQLRNFFKSRSTAGDEAVRRTVKTFQELCRMADFGEKQEKSTEPQKVISRSRVLPVNLANSQPTFSPEVKISIEIQIPADAQGDQIDKIFSSIATHLFGRKSEVIK